MDSGSRVESRRGASFAFPYVRGVVGVFAGSCKADVSSIDVKLEPPTLEGDIGCVLAGEEEDRTGECSGRGREVTIFGAGRRSVLGESERSRVAYEGIST